MATYTVTGHPLNYADIGIPAVTIALINNGVGATVNLTLAGPDDTKVKGHGILK